MDDLIARLEAAVTGGPGLNEAVSKAACGYDESHPEPPPGVTFWNNWALRPYTTSLDAALSLVPEGWHVQLSGEDTAWAVALTSNALREEIGLAPTPALALTIAALRARQSQEDGSR